VSESIEEMLSQSTEHTVRLLRLEESVNDLTKGIGGMAELVRGQFEAKTDSKPQGPNREVKELEIQVARLEHRQARLVQMGLMQLLMMVAVLIMLVIAKANLLPQSQNLAAPSAISTMPEPVGPSTLDPPTAAPEPEPKKAKKRRRRR